MGQLLGDVDLEGDAYMERCLGDTSALVYSVSERVSEVPHSSSYPWPLQCSWPRGTLREESERETSLFSLRCYRETSQAAEICLEIFLGDMQDLGADHECCFKSHSLLPLSKAGVWARSPQQHRTLPLQLVIF